MKISSIVATLSVFAVGLASGKPVPWAQMAGPTPVDPTEQPPPTAPPQDPSADAPAPSGDAMNLFSSTTTTTPTSTSSCSPATPTTSVDIHAADSVYSSSEMMGYSMNQTTKSQNITVEEYPLVYRQWGAFDDDVQVEWDASTSRFRYIHTANGTVYYTYDLTDGSYKYADAVEWKDDVINCTVSYDAKAVAENSTAPGALIFSYKYENETTESMWAVTLKDMFAYWHPQDVLVRIENTTALVGKDEFTVTSIRKDNTYTLTTLTSQDKFIQELFKEGDVAVTIDYHMGTHGHRYIHSTSTGNVFTYDSHYVSEPAMNGTFAAKFPVLC